jgi:DNA invertase Pin-like site-specific DNA recombinase
MDIGYCRVSTDQQNTDLQMDALQEHGCTRIFKETASGSQRDRPQLKAAIDFAREGDVIVVWSLSRLGRSLRQLIETIENLEERQIGFRSLKEKIDTTTPSGRLVFHVFGALAEFERAHLKERTLEGLAAARARGKVGGRPKVMSASDVKAALAMLRDQSISVGDVAEKLGVSRTTLYRSLPEGGRTALVPAGK